MSISLVYAGCIVGVCSTLCSILVSLKPRLILQIPVYILSALNLVSFYFMVKYGIGTSIYVLMILSGFISFNFVRYGSKRISVEEMRNSIWKNAGLLMAGFSLVFTLEVQVVQQLNFSLLMDSVIGISFVGALMAAMNSIRTIVKSRLYKTPPLSSKDQPTVTIAIAARNEDAALSDCLNAILGSDYEKMEVLVLDDCSTDGTGSLMSFYAKSGVRFISGVEPPLGWLGQNWAYQQLEKEAAGDYIIYLSVDTVITPKTISRMVRFAEFYTYEMISLQPTLPYLDIFPQLLQPLKLLWQTTFRTLLKRPPVSSSLWMIKAKSLADFGVFTPIAASINPEKDLATKLYKKDGYFYAFSSADDGVSTRKGLSSLWSTSVRSYYPRNGKNPALTCYAILLILAILIVPFLGVAEAMSTHQFNLNVILGIISVVIWWVAHLMLTTRISPSAWFLAVFNLPIMIAVEVYLSLTSMYKYEFGEVNWKSRNICWIDKEQRLKLDAWRKMQQNLKR
jgi:glycosyltransferase involved in cell wall biosynthesis